MTTQRSTVTRPRWWRLVIARLAGAVDGESIVYSVAAREPPLDPAGASSTGRGGGSGMRSRRCGRPGRWPGRRPRATRSAVELGDRDG